MQLAARGPAEVESLSLADEAAQAHVRRVAVYRDPADVFSVWDRLEAVAAVSPYQTRRWLTPWLETTGRSSGVAPLIVVAFDEVDEPLALLPFGVWRHRMQTVAGFLGGRDSNFNLGLFRPGLTWTSATLQTVLRAAARSGTMKIDLFALCNQPYQWGGVANPFSILPHQPSPSFGYKVALLADPDLFVRRLLSADNRKKLRQKRSRLEGLGPVKHEVAHTPEAGRAIVEAYIGQRLSRCRDQGLGTHDLPSQGAFLERSSIVGTDHPSVDLHALRCGERIVATFAGTAHRGRYCGMVMSFDTSPEVSRCSPGEILLESLIRSKCDEGYAQFDLGIGEARYKRAYCPDPEPLFDSLIAVSARAKLFVIVERARLQVKRRIKQSPRAWAALRMVRRTLHRRRPSIRRGTDREG